jgi:hypothetical protein
VVDAVASGVIAVIAVVHAATVARARAASAVIAAAHAQVA